MAMSLEIPTFLLGKEFSQCSGILKGLQILQWSNAMFEKSNFSKGMR